MIGSYLSGSTARQVAEKFGISLSNVRRLLHQHGVRREHRSSRTWLRQQRCVLRGGLDGAGLGARTRVPPPPHTTRVIPSYDARS
jgi:hypothetical protein